MKKKLVIGFVIIFITVCTISDVYYSGLERNYPLLTDAIPVRGIVENYRVHWGHTYITLDSNRRIHVRPIVMNAWEVHYFDDVLEVGDSLLKSENSDEILLKKRDTVFLFINRQYTPSHAR